MVKDESGTFYERIKDDMGKSPIQLDIDQEMIDMFDVPYASTILDNDYEFKNAFDNFVIKVYKNEAT